ncbi:o-succinylbenzoate synthase [Agilicoccus flavus]|uniref:o-succinylbenzoate synthase n=1 Tax=Agilicoccus flavus TaxID=2775968 RepID=UPI001CF675E5|nr:o-succinylbenzoate synthase [Agilicoccus flavus]
MTSESVPPLPDVAELLEHAYAVIVPLRTRFRGVTHREALLLRGPVGWAEFAPFVEYDDAEASAWLAAAVEAGWVGWPAPRRDTVPVNATLPAVGPEQVDDVLSRYDGCRTVKVKVAQAGQTLRDDVDRVAAARSHLGPAGRVRVDANGAWSLADARAAVAALAPYDLEYVEQPCAAVEDLARLRVALARAALDVRVAADESIRRARDPLRVKALDAADVVVVKVAPLRGVRAALDVVAAVGLPAVVSSALDTSVGMRAGVALAAALPDLPFDCGLGTVELLADDVTTTRLVPRGGFLPVSGAVRPDEVDAAAPARLAAGADRQRWWEERLARAHAVLAG